MPRRSVVYPMTPQQEAEPESYGKVAQKGKEYLFRSGGSIRLLYSG